MIEAAPSQRTSLVAGSNAAGTKMRVLLPDAHMTPHAFSCRFPARPIAEDIALPRRFRQAGQRAMSNFSLMRR